MGRVRAMSDRLRFLNHAPGILGSARIRPPPVPPGPVLCGPECGRGLFSIRQLRATWVALAHLTLPAHGRRRLRTSQSRACSSRIELSWRARAAGPWLLRVGEPRWHNALHVDFGAVDELADFRAYHILPVIALIHGLVQPL